MKQGIAVLSILLLSLAIFPGVNAFADGNTPILREEQSLVIEGVEETWLLEWENPPSPVCGPEDENWLTCPCNGFAFGEWGDLRLVRKRKGNKDECFSLNQIFAYGDDLPKPFPAPGAVLRRWDVLDEDRNVSDPKELAARVQRRPLARVMHFADYDHDGRATEFTLQIGTLPCGKKTNVVVGISRKDNRLHVFSSANRPKQPLILTSWQWEALKNTKGPVRVIDWLCGDHGSEEEMELELRANRGDIYVTRRTYQCVNDSASRAVRGRLLKKEGF